MASYGDYRGYDPPEPEYHEHNPKCPMSPDYADSDSEAEDAEEQPCICQELDEDSYEEEMERRVDREKERWI